MKGFFNRLLRIRLSNKTFDYEPIPDEVLRRTLGGKGLGVYLLSKENPQGIAALAPESRFIICTGSVTGTRIWGQSRFGVYAKSPATGGYGESYCGGTLAPKIKGCGVDAVIIEGMCDSLMFLMVDEEGITFHDAYELAGKDTVESEQYLLEHASKAAGAMVIGPAGENLVRFACIKSDRWRSLGRGGLGAVLGSKRIKGVSFSGTQKAQIADEVLLKQIVKEIAEKGRAAPVTRAYQQLGTPMQVRVTNAQNCFPTRYWQSGHFPKWESLSAEYMQEHFEVEPHGCPDCFLKCTKKSRVKNGRHRGLELEGPEYETIYALGGLNEIDSLEEVAFLNDVCDRLGIDTMSAGNISAFAIEAFKRGKSGFAIDYNRPDRIAALFSLIAKKEGVGAVFARGIKEAAHQLGLEDIAIHVKGLEPGGFDPRVLKGMGLSYATSARGACHLRGTFYKAELSGEIDKDQIAGKAALHIDYEDRAALFDSLILCRFFRDFILWDELGQIIRATTGLILDKCEMEILANSITQATRAYNHREGIGLGADTLPSRFLREPTMEGARLEERELKAMLHDYNSIRESRGK